MSTRMTLRQWITAPYRGPGAKRAAVALWLRDISDRLADGEPGRMHWRWRVSRVLRLRMPTI